MGEVVRRLIAHPRVVVTPHLGANSTEAQVNVAVDVARQLVAFRDGELVEHAVNIPMGDAATVAALRPFVALADRLGRFCVQLDPGHLARVEVTVAGAIATLAQFGFLFGGRGSERPNPIVMIGTALIAPLAAMIIQMAISRWREYDADRIGAEVAGNPLSLASALSKIEQAARAIPNPQAERHPATAPLFIVNPLSGSGMDNLFSTHPATENRIAALYELARCVSGSQGRPGAAFGELAPGSPWAGRPRRSTGPWG